MHAIHGDLTQLLAGGLQDAPRQRRGDGAFGNHIPQPACIAEGQVLRNLAVLSTESSSSSLLLPCRHGAPMLLVREPGQCMQPRSADAQQGSLFVLGVVDSDDALQAAQGGLLHALYPSQIRLPARERDKVSHRRSFELSHKCIQLSWSATHGRLSALRQTKRYSLLVALLEHLEGELAGATLLCISLILRPSCCHHQSCLEWNRLISSLCSLILPCCRYS